MYRCESFNGLMRLHNIHSNRQASSRDIAEDFARIEHVRHILCGSQSRYMYTLITMRTNLLRVGDGLIHLAKAPEIQQFLYGNKTNSSKSIYKSGVLRKVAIELNQCT